MKLTSNHLNNSSKNLFCMLSILGELITTTLVSGLVLSSTLVSADDSVLDEIRITVPIACTLSASGTNSHNATINNGQYNSAIGETTMKAFCNDNEGFAIYAVGFTDDEAGKDVLSNSTLGSNHDIATGTAISGDTSNWAMKLVASSGTYAPIIAGSSADTERESGDPDFTSFQAIPNRYTKVAYRTSNTDVGTNAEGSTLTTTYQAYISPTQAAGAYSGKVKYTMIHPNDADAPITYSATLATGQTVNSKLKSLAATVVKGEETTITPEFDADGLYDFEDGFDPYIKSISVHLETPAPAGFIPSEKNTISTSTSQKPIYIIFDNTNDAGIIHFYTEGEQIVLSPDSSFMFYAINNIFNLSDISSWDTSNVTNMSYMFYRTGRPSSPFILDLSSWNTSNVTNMKGMFGDIGTSSTFTLDISSWDTSNVTNMSDMFYLAGDLATTFTLDLSSWDTSNVTDMSRMFYYAGNSAPIFNLDLSSWNTSNVTNMNCMFDRAGYSATTWSIGDISSWDTSSVTNMVYMFQYAGYKASNFTLNLSFWDTSSVTSMYDMFRRAGNSASTWSVTIPQINKNGISNTTSRFYGQTTSIYSTPETYESFTLAQP